MRRLAIRFAAIAAMTLAVSQVHVGTAHACIKFDRAAEMALVNDAIASPGTIAATKTALVAAREDLRAMQRKKGWNSEDALRHHDLMTKSLSLIGKERIVYRGPSKLETGVFKDRVMPQMAKAKQPDDALLPACG